VLVPGPTKTIAAKGIRIGTLTLVAKAALLPIRAYKQNDHPWAQTSDKVYNRAETHFDACKTVADVWKVLGSRPSLFSLGLAQKEQRLRFLIPGDTTSSGNPQEGYCARTIDLYISAETEAEEDVQVYSSSSKCVSHTYGYPTHTDIQHGSIPHTGVSHTREYPTHGGIPHTGEGKGRRQRYGFLWG
jgi:hypothetical protein